LFIEYYFGEHEKTTKKAMKKELAPFEGCYDE
jgi:hypothetical protein